MKRQDLKVLRDDAKYAFNLGDVVESLQGAGVETDLAIRIARSTEKHYRSNKTVKLEKLVKRVADMVEDELGEDVAERFLGQTPPFVPLSVESGDKVSHFSQRLIVESLEKLGLKLKEAFAIASQVEQSLRSRGYEQVSERELVFLVAQTLDANYGRDMRLRYELQLKQPIEVQVVEAKGEVSPFSRGILAQSFMEIGLAPELSHALARQLETVLLHKGETRISRSQLRKEVRQLLKLEVSEGFAKRYELMRRLRGANRPLIILIGGAPGVGKSTLAYELAYRLGIRRIVSSDAIREALRSLISSQLSPNLHMSSYNAWQAGLLPSEKAQTKAKTKRVERGFQAQVQQLSAALKGIIERSITEGDSVIVEGVHVVPGAFSIEELGTASLLELVLTIKNEAVHKRHFALREEQTEQRRIQEGHLSHFNEVRILHDFIARQAEQEAVPIISATDLEEATDRALELVLHAALVDEEAEAT